MEWNCCWSVNTMTPFLYESSGDSEEVKLDVNEVVMDESDGVSFQYDEQEDVVVDDDDDDAQSCSYDHSSYQHDQTNRLIYDDHEDGNIDDGDDDGVINIDDDDDDDKNTNWDEIKKQKRARKFCGDSLNQREIDRKFWEACLAT